MAAPRANTPEKMSDGAGERDSLPFRPKKEVRGENSGNLPPMNEKEIKTPEELKAEYPECFIL